MAFPPIKSQKVTLCQHFSDSGVGRRSRSGNVNRDLRFASAKLYRMASLLNNAPH